MYSSVLFTLSVVLGIQAAEEFYGTKHDTEVKKGKYGETIQLTVHGNKEYVVRFPDSKSKNPYTVYTWEDQNYHEHPVFVVVRQQKEVVSWEVPLTIESQSGEYIFKEVSRTLCHNNMDVIVELPRNITHNHENQEGIAGLQKYLTMSISTESVIPLNVSIQVDEKDDFYVVEDKEYSFTLTPSKPKFFYYKFLDDSENDLDALLVEIESTENSCLAVSIQYPTCPVSDLNHNEMWFKGKHQTMAKRGGIIVKRRQFPQGFFLVFTAKGDNYECGGDLSTIPQLSRVDVKMTESATVNFTIRESITHGDYLVASLSTLGAIAVFYVIFLIVTWICYRYVKVFRQACTNNAEQDGTERDQHEPDCSFESTDDIDAKLATVNLKLSHLAQFDSEHYERNSSHYLWHVVSIAIFYGIPVIQLVISYQRVVNITGNQDICYYNFLCAHPLIGFSDFNHIFSNIGYVLTGILFLIITFYRNRRVACRDKFGIPRHYGLFYAMGVALIMEGILSACYHICPNQTNFQFDTSFMYVMATLCLVKLYQNRHPDINATAYATFMVLGFAIFAAMVGVLNGHIILWVLFIIAYIILCLYVSFNIYFLSYIKEGVLSVVNEWNEDHNVIDAIKPKRRAHFGLLLLCNIINIVMACLGLMAYFSGVDFATFLLMLLMGNAILYAIIYIIMKSIHREKICIHSAVFGLLGLASWAAASFFFYNKSTEWTVTPAESREWNKHCVLLNFYDYHDIWHLMSSLALFFSFMLLLTLDDDLLNIPHYKISVF